MNSIAICFIIFIVLLALSAPIALALGISAMSVAFFNPKFTADAVFCFRGIAAMLDNYVLLAVPLFILSGNIMAHGGISDRIFKFFAYFIGNKTAGLPCAAVVSCLFYGAISGSGPATVAAIGAMTIPLLTNLGYDKVFVTSLVAIAGGLGVIIPPSIPFVMFGLSSGESVASLFTGGILPGILIGIFLMAGAYVHCRRHGEDKEKLRKNYEEIRAMGLLGIFRYSFFSLLCPVIILGGIYSGFLTPTEAACVSVVYAIVISVFVYKSFGMQQLVDALKETVNGMAAMLFVCSCANVFGRVLTMLQVPQLVATMLTTTFSSKVALLLIINLFLLVVGMLIDTTSAILIVAPILLPAVKAVGMNPIHFGVMMVVNLAIGFVTPPVGVNLYVASAMADIPVMKIAKTAVPYMILFFIACLIITFVPQVSLFLLGGA